MVEVLKMDNFVSPKRWSLPTSPHGVTTHNIIIIIISFIFTAIKT
jgi:hypothetical protein